MDKQIFKKTGEELQQYLQFKRRGSQVKSKKGKGTYTRKIKHKKDDYRLCA
jgi:stalled ribosome alternative rescue factor ArfA